ncbi:MAG: vitamin B12 dependent-methionine synthase activation domain-containing protein [Bacteroidota bacterium]
MIKEFRYSFEDLSVVPEDLYELLGFEDGEIPEPFPEYIESAISEAPLLCNIKGGYRYFDSLEINHGEKTIKIEAQVFSPSKIVTTQLKKSTSAVLFVCTAGAGISNHAYKISTESDPIMGYVFDVLGSITVEKAMDKIQDTLLETVQKQQLDVSDRYSPGYCEWSVAEQHKLFSLLPSNFCDIQLSDSSLMHPIKSVSGIIGIGKGLKQKGYQCQWCNDENCIYGKLKRKKK